MTPPLMRSILVAALAAVAPLTLYAADSTEATSDSEAGRLSYRQCALCHGQWGQGIIGGKYPRISGLPEYYLLRVLDDYRGGDRNYDAMTVVGGLRNMSDEDLANLAAYISDVDLDEVAPLDVPALAGDPEEGEDLYMDDCKTCHGKKGQGKSKKKSPALRGQYGEYLARQIDLFKDKKREHADDPEDETFDDYSPEEITDILTFVTTLDDK